MSPTIRDTGKRLSEKRASTVLEASIMSSQVSKRCVLRLKEMLAGKTFAMVYDVRDRRSFVEITPNYWSVLTSSSFRGQGRPMFGLVRWS